MSHLTHLISSLLKETEFKSSQNVTGMSFLNRYVLTPIHALSKILFEFPLVMSSSREHNNDDDFNKMIFSAFIDSINNKSKFMLNDSGLLPNDSRILNDEFQMINLIHFILKSYFLIYVEKSLRDVMAAKR